MFQHTPLHYFYIGPLRIYVWGLMLAIAVLAGALLAAKKSKKYSIEQEQIYQSVVYIIISAIIGARISYFLAYPYNFSSFMDIFKLWDGGLTFIGGFAGGVLGLFVFTKIYKKNFWKFADLLAPYIALGEAITRIGCFLNWCCYGTQTNLPWAVCVDGTCSHPTQIYHLIANVLIFAILINKKVQKNKFDGKIFALFLMLYSVFRFIVDFWRYYDYKIILSVSQWTMIIVFAIGLVIYLKKRKIVKKIKIKKYLN